ncbi:hypothetical protein CARUB_v10011321mg [Capsella rubella]|uniref:Auxin response factor n=1 Tax=Capsella rubella TaxID=81985 RepID=R0IP37_9BRAS|nr:hypothetical protein CARUB_v10011321mg [Capsella rubella]
MDGCNVANVQPDLSGTFYGSESYMYEQLWKLCAGPLCHLPNLGDKVYYFPQGHIELVEAATREELNQIQSNFDLPSKLECRVISVRLKAEKNTDQVYAEITLIPDARQVVIPTQNDSQYRPKVNSFMKILTASDTSTHGGLSVPKRSATECLPPLDMGIPVPTQDILTKDLHDSVWKFKHSFRGTPQRHLLTTGWSAFVTTKSLVVGDAFILLRGETGELRVGIRRARHQQGNITSSLVSTENMRHGVIASALHAFNNQCMFTVFFKPRSSQFIVKYDKFLDAVNNKFNVGSRFTMRFEADDFSVKRYSGTIIGVNNFSPHWKDSEWRSLQVQWDEFASFPRPEKVSPWEIEHIPPSSNVPQSFLLKNKRSRHVNKIGSSSSSSPHLLPPILTQNPEVVQPSMTNEGGTSLRLFGVSLVVPSGKNESYQVSNTSKLCQEKEFGLTQTFKLPKMAESKQFSSTRSCTKVQMQGVTVGRALDLSVLNGYDQLIYELEKLFDLGGELRSRNQWEMVFIDHEGDHVLIGDVPWLEFCNMVKKILICSKEEVNKLKSERPISQTKS